jgi:hypothetical protein
MGSSLYDRVSLITRPSSLTLLQIWILCYRTQFSKEHLEMSSHGAVSVILEITIICNRFAYSWEVRN